MSTTSVTSGTMSSPGLGSGLDVNGIVTKLVNAEKAPAAQLLNNRGAQIQAQISAYGAVKSALSTFNDAVNGLKDASDFSSFTASASDTSILTASGGSSGSVGSYSIAVSHLATNEQLASGAYASSTAAVGTGTLTFNFGTYSSAGNTFTPNASKATATVTIDSAHSSLQGVRDAVNQANIGVTASIVTDATGSRLVFKASDTGAANAIKLTVSDGDGNNTDTNGLSALAYDPTATAGAGKNLSESVAASNATLTVDGLAISSASNTVTGVLDGVTLNLKNQTSGTPVTVTVGQNTSGITSAVNSLVSSYNSLVSTFNSTAGYDATTKTGGPLQGNSTLINLKNGLAQMLGGMVADAGSLTGLADVGINLQKDGTLQLDSTKLSSALSANPTDVARLFAAVGTPTDPLVSYVSATSNTQPGNYAVSVSQLATQAKYAAAANSTLTVDANNNTLALSVDGVQSGTVSLAQQTYSSGAALATALQSAINGDSALKAAGKTVSVAYVTDHLEISSASYGHNSGVQITSVGTNGSSLGLASGSLLVGQDVAGTIGGVGATGLGQNLTGAGNADGLQIQVNGGATGSRGNISFGRGIADQLNTFLSQYLGSNSPLDAATTGLNTSLKDVQTQMDELNTRMTDLQSNYMKQFNALDVMIQQMQATQSQLTQQLASLPGIK